MAIHACRCQQREEGTVQEAEPARISTTRRAHEYIPALAGRHYGGTNQASRSSARHRDKRQHRKDSS